MNFVPNMILDSTHLLILLQNLKLDPTRKYTLATIDIEALYTNLPLNICKTHCCNFFSSHKSNIDVPFNINVHQLRSFLDLCLDYSFVK